MSKDIDPARWLRKRPDVSDSPEEFLRDYEDWAAKMLQQGGFNWGEFKWFAQRAGYLINWLDRKGGKDGG